MPRSIRTNLDETDYRKVRERSLRGAAFGGVLVAVKAAISFGSLLILSRLLKPSDFGIVAMAGISIGLFRIVGDCGLVMASIQRRDMTNAQLSTLFWINVGVGGLLALVAVLSAPALVAVFGEPILFRVTLVLSVVLIALGIGAQHEAILRRALDYGYLQAIGAGAQAFGLLVAVLTAIAGLGFWALVFQQVSARIIETVFLWYRTGWVPAKPRRDVGAKSFLQYGGRLVTSHLLAHIARSFGDFVVGISSDPTNLGYFRRATNIVMMTEQLKQPLKSIMPASLSRVQNDHQSFTDLYLYGLALWSFAALGVVGIVAAEAPLIVDLLLGDGWERSAPLVRWLVPAGVAAAIGSATDWMLMPLARMKRLLALRLIRAGCAVVGILLGARWGVNGVAAGYSISVIASLAIELWLSTAVMPMAKSRILGSIVRPALAAGVAGATVFCIHTSSNWIHILELLVYAALFFGLNVALPGGRVLFVRLLGSIRRVVGTSRFGKLWT